MKHSSRWILVCLAAAAVVIGLRALIPTDEQRIRKLLTRLAQEASVGSEDKPLTDLAAANRLADFFAPEFQVNVSGSGIPDLNVSERAELVQAILAARSRRQSIKAELLDPQVIQLDPARAVVETTARVQATGEPDPFVEELRFTLVKIEGRWRVQKVENLRTFE